jgi:hypothetical protein
MAQKSENESSVRDEERVETYSIVGFETISILKDTKCFVSIVSGLNS